MQGSWKFSVVVFLWLPVCGLESRSAAADRPSWQCLPDETMFVARVPALAPFVEALKSRTKLGAVVTDETRWVELRKLLEEEVGEDWRKLKESYEKIGITTDELWNAASGEIGYAGVVTDLKHPYVGLAWMECGREPASKWLAALDQKLAEQEPGPTAVRREDLDLAGRKVIQLTIPGTGPKQGKFQVNLGVNSSKGIQFGAEVKPDEKAKDAELVEFSQTFVLLARRDEGLVAAHATVLLLDDEGTDRKVDASAVLEAARSTFVRFLESHADRDEGIVERWRQTPGLTNAMPDGDVLVDVLVDAKRLIGLADQPDTQDVWSFLKASSLDAIGPFSYRATLDGTIFRSAMFLAMPAPRTGLQALVEQPAIKPEPAAWVNRSVVGYQHISCDLGKVYQLASRIVRERLPRGSGALDTLETQSQAFLQVDPATLLSALGRTHTILTYLPTVAETDDARTDDDSASRTATAFVWISPDEAVWRRLIQLLSKATAKPVLTEQGFTGLRYDEKTMSGGWFIGNGYMVVAVGKGVTEKVLANLRSTPRTDESLRHSPHAVRAAELLPPTPSITYDLTDAAGLMNFANGVMRRAFEDPTDPDAAKLKKLWPTEAELEGAIGVSVSAVVVEDDGLVYRSILELPSP